MIPKSFDNDTCSELVGDATKRLLETKGRALADSENGPPKRKPIAGSYWSQVQDEAAYRVELAAYQKRVDRIARMSKAMNIPKTDKLPTGTDAVGNNEEQLRRKELAEAEIRASQESAITDEFIARMKARVEQYEPKLGPDADLSKLTSTIPQ